MATNLEDQLTRQLRGDEAVRPQVYQDSLGYWTIGVGRLVDSRKPGCGLRDNEINLMLANDIADREEHLAVVLPWTMNLDEARRGALINMSFQLGIDGLLTFKNSLALIQSGNYDQAYSNLMMSKWATQTPERAKRVATQIKTGEWQFAEGT